MSEAKRGVTVEATDAGLVVLRYCDGDDETPIALAPERAKQLGGTLASIADGLLNDRRRDEEVRADGGPRQASDEFLHRVDAADPENDPLAGVESHGGYWGFEVPEDFDR